MFNYFLHSIVLIFLGYCSIYPILFWTTPLKKIEPGFYRFNLGKCCVVGSLGVIAYYYAYKQGLEKVPTIEEMSTLLANLIDLDLFLQIQNGNLPNVLDGSVKLIYKSNI